MQSTYLLIQLHHHTSSPSLNSYIANNSLHYHASRHHSTIVSQTIPDSDLTSRIIILHRLHLLPSYHQSTPNVSLQLHHSHISINAISPSLNKCFSSNSHHHTLYPLHLNKLSFKQSPRYTSFSSFNQTQTYLHLHHSIHNIFTFTLYPNHPTFSSLSLNQHILFNFIVIFGLSFSQPTYLIQPILNRPLCHSTHILPTTHSIAILHL